MKRVAILVIALIMLSGCITDEQISKAFSDLEDYIIPRSTAVQEGTVIWPSDAPSTTCYCASGCPKSDMPSTGKDAATWFEFGGCGNWKVYDVTPGSSINIHAYGDTCDGCVLWHINYYLDDYHSGEWHEIKYVNGPNKPGAVYDMNYTPVGNKIRVRAVNGFYVKVFKNV